MSQIERSFAPLIGMPCWGVSRGYGSFLTLEFGAPKLIVREPREPTRKVSPRVQREFARRLVSVHGRWHLWIYCCEWYLRDSGKLVGDWTTPRRIDRAARVERSEVAGCQCKPARVRAPTSHSTLVPNSKPSPSIGRGSNGCCTSRTDKYCHGVRTGSLAMVPATALLGRCGGASCRDSMRVRSTSGTMALMELRPVTAGTSHGFFFRAFSRSDS